MSDIPEDNTNWGLVLPFLDDNPVYAHGVEFGMLFARMKTQHQISDYVTLANQEQVTLAANRCGWQIDRMEPWEGGDWFWLEMHRK